MENGKMNKVTKNYKRGGKKPHQEEKKCLAKFTAANGNVYGSLTLDIRKAGDYSQPLPVAVRVCHGGQKDFPALRKIIHYGRMVGSLRFNEKKRSAHPISGA